MSAADDRTNLSELYFGHDHLTIMKPQTGYQLLHFNELWAYRELLSVLTMRHIKVRYKQTV
jgi:lipopolysaccharide transport system permease protein